jgi:hypothetical protein
LTSSLREFDTSVALPLSQLNTLFLLGGSGGQGSCNRTGKIYLNPGFCA